MQPETEGLEEQGPSRIPFINDPRKPASPAPNDPDEVQDDESIDEDVDDQYR